MILKQCLDIFCLTLQPCILRLKLHCSEDRNIFYPSMRRTYFKFPIELVRLWNHPKRIHQLTKNSVDIDGVWEVMCLFIYFWIRFLNWSSSKNYLFLQIDVPKLYFMAQRFHPSSPMVLRRMVLKQYLKWMNVYFFDGITIFERLEIFLSIIYENRVLQIFKLN